MRKPPEEPLDTTDTNEKEPVANAAALAEQATPKKHRPGGIPAASQGGCGCGE